jgi:signal transduction histidine kinase
MQGAFIALFLVWALLLMIQGRHGFASKMQLLRHIEIYSRNVFGLIGGVVTAYGLIAYSREIKNLSGSISNKLFYAGITFAFYGIVTSGYFSFFAYVFLPLPVEIFRGVSAVLITVFIIRALNIFDVETRRRIEQQTRHLVQAEKLTSLGQLAAGIAHEINNPLTNASLGIQTLKSKLSNAGGEQDKEIAAKLDAVERNIDRASTIAQELLQFSRQRETEFVPLNINDVIKSSLTLMQHKLKMVKVDQNLSTVPDILGDTGKLEQVFINVLSNALEAMPVGGTIAIDTLQKDGMVEVRLVDTGTGIPGKNVSRVFDPFFTTKEVGLGTGLGLSICYGIIRQHHGRIQLSSAVGQGTTVIITIPTRERYDENIDRGR